MIVNLLLVEHKIVYTMVSLDTFVADTTPLDNYSQQFLKSKDNIMDMLTKGLNKELVEKSSRGMGLKPIKE